MKVLVSIYQGTGYTPLNEKLLCLFVYCASCNYDVIAICEEKKWWKVVTSLHDL